MKSDKKKVVFFCLLPFALGLLLFYIIPFVISIYYSLTKTGSTRSFVGIQNYIDLLGNRAFRLALKNTFIFMIISVPLVLIVSLFIALLINKSINGVRFFRATFTLPLVVPVVSIVLFYLVLFSDNGLVNSILSKLNLGTVSFFNSGLSMVLLITLYVWKNSSYCIILFLVGLNNIPQSIYDAAKVDGAGKFKTLTRITIPMLLPTIVLNVVVSVINCFNVYRISYTLFGDYQDPSCYMIQNFMNNNFKNFNYQRLCTSSIIVFTIVGIIMYAIIRYERRREA